jgi:hypothetical protein
VWPAVFLHFGGQYPGSEAHVKSRTLHACGTSAATFPGSEAVAVIKNVFREPLKITFSSRP